MTTDQTSEPFSDPRNINVGRARVIYGPYSYGVLCTHCWHLPGMRTTTDRNEAYTVALKINEMLGGI